MTPSTTLFVGLGSPHGDDQVGWLVVEELELFVTGCRCRQARTPAELLDWLDDCHHLVLCDAMSMGEPPGSIASWVWPSPEIAEIPFYGSHDLSLQSTLALAERLDRLPAKVCIWGVQIGHANPNQPISTVLVTRVPDIARRIYEAWRAS